MEYKYKLESEKLCYKGFFELREYTVSFDRFGGGEFLDVKRECGKPSNVVAVLPYDPIKKEFIMIEQFRIGLVVRGEHPWAMEIVAGFIDVEGESKEETAIRETKEETGCDVKSLKLLSEYYTGPGGSAGKVFLFLAEIDIDQAEHVTGLEIEAEDIKVHKISLKEARDKLKKGEIDNATALIGFQKFFLDTEFDV